MQKLHTLVYEVYEFFSYENAAACVDENSVLR